MSTTLRATLRGALAVGLTAALAACGSSGSAGSDTVSIGAAISKSGYLATFDTAFVQGAKIAIEEINAAGGVRGKKFELDERDVASAASNGVPIVNQLMNQEKVDVLLLGSSSAVTQATAPVVKPKDFPVLSLGAVPQTVDWVQQIQPPLLPWAVNSGTNYLSSGKKAKRVAIVYSQSPLGQRFADLAKSTAERAGFEISQQIGVEATATDLSTQSVKIKQSGTDAILNYLSGPSGIVFAKALKSAGLTIPDVISAQDELTFGQAAKEYPNSLYVALPSQTCPSIKDAAQRATCEKLVKQGSDVDSAYLAQGYDAVRIIAKAVEQSDGTKLADALRKVTLTGINGKYDYNGDHTGVRKVGNQFRIAKSGSNGELEVVFMPDQA